MDQVNGKFTSGLTHVSACILSRNVLYKMLQYQWKNWSIHTCRQTTRSSKHNSRLIYLLQIF